MSNMRLPYVDDDQTRAMVSINRVVDERDIFFHSKYRCARERT